ncbi:hypothetical protein CAPTEDRAFT_169414 [Capitella teleta]|uniref:Glutathione transferase n=1 Tax=Capitella teleta TaxID=283909 RepID=R7TS82_CAPTE|nr:hypothetical protein CAPTEDRAFT_169414 [Capitella teleta]|eukprot:ELT96462.1 hypothetical protein CAPTEDRAFT_169414 [Capitella teleta]
MKNFKLTYFKGRGRAELIRWIFQQSNVVYEDCRIERDEWAKLKPETPFQQLPILEIDGHVFSQSLAIARFLAKQFGLVGETLEDEAQADMLVNCCEDLVNGMGAAHFEKDAEKKAEMISKFEEKMKSQLSLLESLLKLNRGGDAWFIGDQVTWADLAVAIYTGDWIEPIGVEPEWSLYPKLSAHRKRVLALPRIADWLKRRPLTPM